MAKKIYVAITEIMEVDENLTESQIDRLIFDKANGKDYCWSEKDNLYDHDTYTSHLPFSDLPEDDEENTIPSF